jgi:hypothetical protein
MAMIARAMPRSLVEKGITAVEEIMALRCEENWVK